MFALRRSVAPIVQRSLTSSRQASTFAKMTLVGRLADTPELQATSTGREIVRYALATTSGRGETEKTSWFRVTSFTPEGAQRDFLTSLEKGTLVYVEGEASMSTYNDAEGKPRSALNIVQNKLEVLSSKKRTGESESH